MLAEPDADWAAQFLAERERIAPCFPAPPRLIEHMGSTAVPGLVAKPIIDIIVLVDDLEGARPAIPALVAAGYVHRDDFPMPDRIFLMRLDAETGLRTHQLHIHGNEAEVQRHLIFRDRLRSDRAVRDAYAALKRDLAQRHGDDRQAYSQHKTAFIDAIVAESGGADRAQQWNP